MVRQGGKFKSQEEWDGICKEAAELLERGKKLSFAANKLGVNEKTLHYNLKQRNLTTRAQGNTKGAEVPQTATEAKLEAVREELKKAVESKEGNVKSELQLMLDNMRKERDQWLENYDTLQKDNTRLEVEVRDLRETVSIKEKELARLQGELNRAQAELVEARMVNAHTVVDDRQTERITMLKRLIETQHDVIEALL